MSTDGSQIRSDPGNPTGSGDTRGLPEAERRDRKELALQLHQRGESMKEIVRLTGLSHGTVSSTIKAGRYQPPKARGRRSGQGRSLTPQEELDLRITIRQRSPRMAGVGAKDWMWTTAAVSRLIEKKTGTKLSRRGVGKYLVRWGISLEDSAEAHPARCVDEIKLWWRTHEAEVLRDAASRDAVVCWLNHAVPLEASTWHSAASPPTQSMLRLLSAETRNGGVYWRLYKGDVTAEMETQFLDNLHRHIRKRLILIRTKRPIYHREEVLSYVAGTAGLLTLLPPR